jgi:hypothetical protein
VFLDLEIVTPGHPYITPVSVPLLPYYRNHLASSRLPGCPIRRTSLHPHACLSFLRLFSVSCYIRLDCSTVSSIVRFTKQLPHPYCITPFPVWSSPFVPNILRFLLMKLLRHARISLSLTFWSSRDSPSWETWCTFCSSIHSWLISRLFWSFLRCVSSSELYRIVVEQVSSSLPLHRSARRDSRHSYHSRPVRVLDIIQSSIGGSNAEVPVQRVLSFSSRNKCSPALI